MHPGCDWRGGPVVQTRTPFVTRTSPLRIGIFKYRNLEQGKGPVSTLQVLQLEVISSTAR